MGIHPESYGSVQAIARDMDWDLGAVMGRPEQLRDIELKANVTPVNGLPTLKEYLTAIQPHHKSVYL